MEEIIKRLCIFFVGLYGLWYVRNIWVRQDASKPWGRWGAKASRKNEPISFWFAIILVSSLSIITILSAVIALPMSVISFGSSPSWLKDIMPSQYVWSFGLVCILLMFYALVREKRKEKQDRKREQIEKEKQLKEEQLQTLWREKIMSVTDILKEDPNGLSIEELIDDGDLVDWEGVYEALQKMPLGTRSLQKAIDVAWEKRYKG